MLHVLPLAGDRQLPYAGLLLLPGLFFFAAELYILQTSYSVLPSSISSGEAGKHGALFLIQILELAALLCTLYAYQQICRSFQAQAALRSLEQAAQAQKTYIAEAQTRYEQTKAFRHDIANHLSVLDGLLNSGKLDEGRAYLRELKTASASLSFPYQTGNPVVDILLSEKLGLAKEIEAEPRIYFDGPERAADAPQKRDGLPDPAAPDEDKDVDGPEERASEDSAESCTCNTGKVDREIETLKKKREALQQQISSETNDIEIRELKKKLAQIERELSRNI